MFPPVPPRQDPPPQPEAYAPAEPEPADYLPPIARTGPSARSRVVRFALIGGGITSIIAGIVFGWMGWFVTPARGAPFGFPEHFAYESSLLGVRIVTTIAALAPFLFLVFALAGAAQVIAESMARASGRAARVLGDVLSESAAERRPRRTTERRRPAPGTAADIVRPLSHDPDLEIDSAPPGRE